MEEEEEEDGEEVGAGPGQWRVPRVRRRPRSLHSWCFVTAAISCFRLFLHFYRAALKKNCLKHFRNPSAWWHPVVPHLTRFGRIVPSFLE